MSTYREQFTELLNTSHPKSFTQKLKSSANKDLYNWFLNETSHLAHIKNVSVKTKVYLNDLDKIPAPKCLNCENIVNERDKNYKWKEHCSKKCRGQHNSLLSRNKAKQTCIENWGVENPAQDESIQLKMKNTMMERHGVEHPLQSKEIREKFKQTNLERFGFEHAAQSSDIKHKTRQTNLGRFGVENPMLNDYIKNKCVESISKTNNIKFGVSFPFQSPDIQSKCKETWSNHYIQPNPSFKHIDEKTLAQLNDTNWLVEQSKNYTPAHIANQLGVSPSYVYGKFREHNIRPINHKRSTIELEITSYLLANTDTEIISNSRHAIGKELDIFLPEYNIAFEINGSYWHSELNGKNKHYHLEKTMLCNQQGITLIHVWEHTYNERKEIILSKIKHILSKSTKIYARKCSISEITPKEAKVFLDSTHIQGYCMSKIKLGLFYKNELVGVMTFGKPRFNKKYEYELLRYATKLNSTVVGGFSKVLSHFIKTYNPRNIITYSDKTWSKGNVYSKNNFEYSHNIPPAYYYTKDYRKFESRMAYQKRKLEEKLESFDPNMTEWENMVANGYDRIWNCGNDAWIWQKQKTIV